MISASTLIIIIVLIVGAIAGVVYIVTSQIRSLRTEITGKDSEKVLMEWLKDMRGSVEKSSETLERQLRDQRDSMDKQTKMIWERLDNAAKVIGGIQKHLGGLEEFNKDMKDLSNILKSPKLRGGLGEQFLYEILENFLPKDLYKTQYRFRDGTICDAIIITDKGYIPIDSKFSTDNFKSMYTAKDDDAREKFKKEFIKDVKKRIDEIASKYILPEEGTTDQAIMYIPSENIYYELVVNNSSVEEYARQKNVLLTSPNTFSYFIKIVVVAYQQNELAKHAGVILKSISGIQVEADKFNEDLNVLDGHISRTTKSMDNVRAKFGRLFGKIVAVQSIDSHDQPSLLEDQ